MYSPLFCFGWNRKDYWEYKEWSEQYWIEMGHPVVAPVRCIEDY